MYTIAMISVVVSVAGLVVCVVQLALMMIQRHESKKPSLSFPKPRRFFEP